MAKLPDLFLDRDFLAKVPTRRVRWKAAYRLVPSRYPPISIFERLAGPEDCWSSCMPLEGLTNPRLREAAGRNKSRSSIAQSVWSRCVSCHGAILRMRSPDRPTRFSTGWFGLYYAGKKSRRPFERSRFIWGASTPAPPILRTTKTFRAYEGAIDSVLHDLRKGDWAIFLDPNPTNYVHAQTLGGRLRDSGSNGVVYPSVRHRKGECIGAFWPRRCRHPSADQTYHVEMEWRKDHSLVRLRDG